MESDQEMINIESGVNMIPTHNITSAENDIEILKNEDLQLDIVTEGKATVRLSNDDKSFSAFYNPAQVK